MTGENLSVTGAVCSGLGEAADFTQVGWVRRAFVDLLGIDPYPGTVNLAVTPAAHNDWQALREAPGVHIPAGQPGFCDATAWPVIVGDGTGVEAAAAVLLPHVPDYPADKIELISAHPVREMLGLSDGDVVSITLRPGAPDAP